MKRVVKGERLMNVMEWVKGLFAGQDDTLPIGKQYSMGGGWGNAINWLDYKNGKIVGWKFDLPVVGDVVASKMKSGKTAVFQIVDINYCLNPSDMFFATVRFKYYEEA